MTDEPDIIQDFQPAPVSGHEWECCCARCGSSIERELCGTCDGVGLVDLSDADFDDDDGDWSDRCPDCDGEGGWWRCLSSPEYCLSKPRPGRERAHRNDVQWYLVPRDQHG
jgi:hypothetical protein